MDLSVHTAHRALQCTARFEDKACQVTPTPPCTLPCIHARHAPQLEALDLVERAFVHVDYARRDQPEHRTERLLAGLPVVAEEPLLPSPHPPRSGSGRRMSSESSAEASAALSSHAATAL